MYLRRIQLENIQSFSTCNLSFSEGQEAGWHVVIGDNGAGKTGLLRAVAVGLCGPGRFKSFRYNERRMLRQGAKRGEIGLTISAGKEDSVNGSQEEELVLEFIREDARLVSLEGITGEKSKIWKGTYQWFSTSFGPFRRLTGGNEQSNRLLEEDHRAGAHLSLFEAELAFVAVDDWLKRLYDRREKLRREKPGAESFLDRLIKFINQSDLLPHGFLVDKVDFDGMFFKAPGQKDPIPFDWLSEGYRSVLSMMLELIRQMEAIFFPESNDPDAFFARRHETEEWVVTKEGVVMIDEVDAHLHPTWQVRIGHWLTRFFPHIQFIVTTHSPLICRAAAGKGSIWRLPKPGTGEVTEKIEGREFNRLVYGNVLDAYGTEVFGENVTSSDLSTQKRERLAELNKKSIKGIISADESKELMELRTILPT